MAVKKSVPARIAKTITEFALLTECGTRFEVAPTVRYGVIWWRVLRDGKSESLYGKPFEASKTEIEAQGAALGYMSIEETLDNVARLEGKLDSIKEILAKPDAHTKNFVGLAEDLGMLLERLSELVNENR